MAIVTHHKNLRIDAAPYGANVTGDRWTDHVFQSSTGIHLPEFHGKAGLIREARSGSVELALFDGTRIASHGVSLSTSGGLAISASFESPGEVTGRYVSSEVAHLTLQAAPSGSFYVDGAHAFPTNLPAGKHTWQWTSGLPTPMPPQILHTQNSKRDATVFFTASAGAETYRIQKSSDTGNTWQEAGSSPGSPARLSGIAPGKLHVRIIALNGTRASAPGPEYPVYITEAAPPHPDGLKLELGSGQLDVRWGEVLGVEEYCLYRRAAGSPNFELVYHGPNRQFHDRAPGVIPAFEEPGLAADAARPPRNIPIYQYVIAARNGNGEGARSSPVDTNPASWRNWDPKPHESFRRRQTYNTTNYSQVGQEQDISRYYPK
jgi:hypothetical protein